MSQLLVRQSLLERDRLRSAVPECKRAGGVDADFGVVDEGVPQVWGELDAGGVEGGELFLVVAVGGLPVLKVADLGQEFVVVGE